MAIPDPRVHLNHIDLCLHAEMTIKIHGNETSWIDHVAGGPDGPGLVSLRCKQLRLLGNIDDLEAVVADWIQLLTAVRARPEDRRRLGFAARRQEDGTVAPHPFALRADGEAPASGPYVSEHSFPQPGGAT